MRAWVTPRKPSTKLRKIAASTMSMIIAVVRIVPSNAAFSMFQLRVRVQTESTSAKQTPTEAASVGVATPA